MKKIIFSLALLPGMIKLFSQSSTLSKDYYLKKSKTQKTTAWILLGTGAASILTGVIIDNSNKGNQQSYTGGYVEVSGIICTLASSLFFIRSAKNARKAAILSFKNQKILFPQHNTFVLKTQPALALKIVL